MTVRRTRPTTMMMMADKPFRNILIGIIMQFVFVATVSSIVVRETVTRPTVIMTTVPFTVKRSQNNVKQTENVTDTDAERYKRILPYLQFYSERKPAENILTQLQHGNSHDEIHYLIPIEAESQPKNPYTLRHKPPKEVFVQFTKYNAQPGPFVPIPRPEVTKPPNYSEIYDKLSTLKMLQLNSLDIADHKIKPVVKLTTTTRPTQNIGKGPPSQPRERTKPTKTIIYLQPPLRQDYYNPHGEEMYPIQYDPYENKKQEEYDNLRESVLTHNNKQFFYEHPVITPAKPDNLYITQNQQHQSYYVPQYFKPTKVVNHNADQSFFFEDVPPTPSSAYKPTNYPVLDEPNLYPLPNFQNPKEPKPKTKPKPKQTQQQTTEEFPKMVPDQQRRAETVVPVPPKLVELISQNTMKYYQNIPTAASSVPNLSEEVAKKNQGVFAMVPLYLQQTPSNHREETIEYEKTPDLDYTNTIVPPRESNLDTVLKKLQDTNTLPKTFTVDNIDNSIKTLVHILSSLKKQKKLLQPVVISSEKEVTNYKDIENEAEGPITTENFPGDTPEGGTPGRPGIDYPALSVIPPTSFDCKTQRYKGFFADPETQCQVWHYCDLNGGQASFLCPNGTTFSQVALTCDWWYNVKCASTPQLYVLNERLYKYIIPLTPKFPEDYSGPLVDKYLAIKFKEMEEKMRKQKKGKQPSETQKDNTETKSEEVIENSDENRNVEDPKNPSVITLSEVNE